MGPAQTVGRGQSWGSKAACSWDITRMRCLLLFSQANCYLLHHVYVTKSPRAEVSLGCTDHTGWIHTPFWPLPAAWSWRSRRHFAERSFTPVKWRWYHWTSSYGEEQVSGRCLKWISVKWGPRSYRKQWWKKDLPGVLLSWKWNQNYENEFCL